MSVPLLHPEDCASIIERASSSPLVRSLPFGRIYGTLVHEPGYQQLVPVQNPFMAADFPILYQRLATFHEEAADMRVRYVPSFSLPSILLDGPPPPSLHRLPPIYLDLTTGHLSHDTPSSPCVLFHISSLGATHALFS